MKTKTLASKHSMNCSHGPLVLLLIVLALACFALAPQVRATCQEGCLTNRNTVLGDDALLNSGSVSANTAIGYHAIHSEQYGGGNTAVGISALELLYDAFGNTAIGAQAMSANTYSNYNTAVGNEALGATTRYADSMNTAVGYQAMALATAFGCTAVGYQALFFTERENNVAIGNESLTSNSTGTYNTAVGWVSLFNNSTGFNNVGIGSQALSNNTTGSNNVAVGAAAGSNLTTGSNNIDIRNIGTANEANTIRLVAEGAHTASYIAGIRNTGLVTGNAVAVAITADGQLGVRGSSARFKELVKPMDKASEAILALQPVTFRYKNDPAALPQFGLVAEEVAKVNPVLVARDVEGKPFTVRYDEINAMLLNEFLKEHGKVQKLEATVANLVTTVKEQASEMRKVRAQLELSKCAPQTVLNNP